MNHRRYSYGDINNPTKSQAEEIQEDLDSEGVVLLPVYMIDHSGIGFSTTNYGDKWDSEEVGFIYATKKKVKEMLGEPETPEKVAEILKAEIAHLDLYARGQNFGFTLYELIHCAHCDHTREEELESYWGYTTQHPVEDILESLEKKYQEILGGK
jgi:hypothetical protein